VEAFASYKDSYTILKEVLKGISIVEKAQLQGDKVAKASSTIQVPFEFGNVYFNRNIDKDTLDEFLSVLGVFPSGKHDDDVDALSVLVGKLTESNYNLYGNGVLS
jgi:phage terminase large subunit-like protein